MTKYFFVFLLALACFIEGYHIYYHEHCEVCAACDY